MVKANTKKEAKLLIDQMTSEDRSNYQIAYVETGTVFAWLAGEDKELLRKYYTDHFGDNIKLGRFRRMKSGRYSVRIIYDTETPAAKNKYLSGRNY